MAVSPSIFKLESQSKNRNACQTMNDTLNLTVVVLIVLVQIFYLQNMVSFCFYSIVSSPNVMCQMWCAIRWPQTPALFRTLLWNYIFKIVGDTNFQKMENVNFVCCLSPSDFKQQSRCSVYQNTMPGPICSANFSRIGPVVSEIFKFLQGLPISGCQVFPPE